VVECASLENWYTCKGIESSNLSPSAILPPYVAIVLTNILTNSVRKHNDYNRLIVFGWTRKPLCACVPWVRIPPPPPSYEEIPGSSFPTLYQKHGTPQG
jgi:hypothetical protein